MIKGIWVRLRSSPIAKILLGSAGGQGILLLASPLLTRLYAPTDFGSLAVLTAFSAVIAVFATLRWEAGIVLPQKDTDAKALGWLALGSAAFISFLAYISTQLWPSSIELFAGSGAASIYSWILPLTIMAISFHKILSAWMVRKEQFVRLGQRNFLVGFGQLCVQLGLGAFGIRPIGLLLGLAGGRLAGMGGAFGPTGLFAGPQPRLRDIFRVAQRYKRFPLVSSLSATVNSVGLQAPVLILSAFYGGVAFGLLALTMRVLTAPVGIISDAVSQHFEAVAAKGIRSSRTELLLQVRRTVLRQLFIGAIPVALIITYGPVLFKIVFGDSWESSGVFAQILILGYYSQFVISPVSKTLLLLELHGRQAVWDVCRAIAIGGGLVGCALLEWDLFQACIIMVLVQIFSYGSLLLIVIHAVKSKADPVIMPVPEAK
ncbi:oligosaccharide flippase family protein [Arthrobacter sp.]|uniref:lipopolysaccharide biosynthesis protein n=1 Tax=Arthrobacter sp. TaxID=1667 RepID=UPI00281116E0|nr:oligosaccharide flippase family protein [Arthrobacter sp.]